MPTPDLQFPDIAPLPTPEPQQLSMPEAPDVVVVTPSAPLPRIPSQNAGSTVAPFPATDVLLPMRSTIPTVTIVPCVR